jgi:hypothetical protein
LIVGGLALVDGLMLLGYSPGTFVFAAVFALLAALLSFGRVRVASISVCAASIVVGIIHFERKQHVDGLMRAAVERARTNSSSR